MEDATILDNIQSLIHVFNIVLSGARPYGQEPIPFALKPSEGSHEHSGSTSPSPVIRVNSAAEECRHVTQERCPCGGFLVSNLQSSESSASGQFDDINAACVECGSVRRFKFLLENIHSRPLLRCA